MRLLYQGHQPLYYCVTGTNKGMSAAMRRLFPHIPKCAGSSVFDMLAASSKDEVVRDYENFFRIPRPERNTEILKRLLQPLDTPANKIVFGHFFPVKYIGADGPGNKFDLRLVTILRDPIERLKSHYRFWNSGSFSPHYLWEKMKAESWSFEDFAFSSEMKNYYSQFFTQIPLGTFSYIGICENLAESIRRCFEVLGVAYPGDIAIPRLNVTSSDVSVRVSEATRQRLQDFHSDDYLLFNYAFKKFHYK